MPVPSDRDPFREFHEYLANLSPAMRNLVGPVEFHISDNLVHALSDTPAHLHALESRLGSTLRRLAQNRFNADLVFSLTS